MDLNPAVAFLSVLVLGAMFGALGAFLALPVTASIQAILKVYLKRYELVDSPLMSDPVPERKSRVVEGAEAFNEHVIKPMSDRIPRAARGSTSRAPVDDELRRLQEDLYPQVSQSSPEDSMTVAIPRGALAPHGVSVGSEASVGSEDSGLSSGESRGTDVTGADNGEVGSDAEEESDDDGRNPRARWR